LIKLARHIAQNRSLPAFYLFEDREKYDLDQLALTLVDKTSREQNEYLMREFIQPGTLWKTFYKTYQWFKAAFDGAINRILMPSSGIIVPKPVTNPSKKDRELSLEEREMVLKRDNYACLCCGLSRFNTSHLRLEIDHIVSFSLGGDTSVENSQTLCLFCNRKVVGINEVNFRNTITMLRGAKVFVLLPVYEGRDNWESYLNRTINYFYHCRAVSEIKVHGTRKGKYYSNWRVELYPGNNPDWLIPHKDKIIAFLRDQGYEQLQDLEIVVPK
jgi:hypothetical protein